MSRIVITDLCKQLSLDDRAMSRIQGGISLNPIRMPQINPLQAVVVRPLIPPVVLPVKIPTINDIIPL